MKKFLGIIGCVLLATICLSRPAFENGQYYVWDADQSALAEAALKYINIDSNIFPFIQDHTKTRILQWYPQVETRTDGKLCFPRIPESLLDVMKIPEPTRELFYSSFHPTVEVCEDWWFEED